MITGALEGASGRMGANACLPFLAASNLLRLSGLITAICASRFPSAKQRSYRCLQKVCGLALLLSSETSYINTKQAVISGILLREHTSRQGS